jgi:simple sugar transport system permease protein
MIHASQTAATQAASTRYRELTWQRLLMRSSAANIGMLSVMVGLATVFASLAYPGEFNFYTAGNLGVLSQQVPIMAIVAIGAGFLMISGEFDLSVAGIYTVVPYVVAIASVRWALHPGLALLIGLAVAVVVALVNGLVTVRLRVPSFIATLGMMFFLRGVSRWVAIDPKTGQPGPIPFDLGDTFHALTAGTLFGPVHAQAVWLLGVALLAVVLLTRHTFGNHLMATGGDVDASEKNGIDTRRIKVLAFVVCAVCAALAGVLQSARIGVVSPASTLNGLELASIAACVVGGVHLFGGRGNVLGMVLGATLLVVVENLLVLVRAPGEYSPAFIGAIVIASVIFNSNVGAAGNRAKT